MRRANVQEMLERIADKKGLWYSPFSVTVECLAPKVEAALRETAESMENYYLSCGVPHNRKRSKAAMDKCVTAGIERLGETT